MLFLQIVEKKEKEIGLYFHRLKNVKFKLLETAGEYLINKLHVELHEKVDIQKITVEFKKLNIANSHTNCAFHGIFIEKSFI